MELTFTDERKNDIGVLRGAKADMAYGGDENEFAVELSADGIPPELKKGSLIYAEGSEWGGRVTRIRTVTADGLVVFGGRTWHGMLADRVVVPPAGEDHFRVSGEGNACIRALVDHCGLSGAFAVSGEGSGVAVPQHGFERFCDAYTGLRKMLASGGGKLKIRSETPKPVLYAAPIVDWSAIDDIDSTQTDVDAQVDYCPVNHLVCAGVGEGRSRLVVHLYADRAGNVSRTQTIFGEDEVQEFYDYPNADEAELTEKGTERLKSYQNPRSGDLVLDPSMEYDVGDIVGRSDPYTGVDVASSVSKAILRLSDRASVTYELGEMRAAQTRGAVAESSGGVSYVAGDGIRIAGRTISADVGASDLERVEGAAEGARAQASDAAAAAGAAQQAAAAAVSEVSASGPIEAERDGQAVSLSHAASGVAAGTYGPGSHAFPKWGGTVTVGARMSVDAGGHVTHVVGRTLKLPDSVATPGADGLMGAADKAKLDGMEAGATKTAVDAALSATSGNPVANRAVASALAGKADESHTHPYAGSSEPGGPAGSALECTGNAATADRLKAARRVSIAGAVTGSASFDGSADVTITVEGDTEAAGFLAAHPVGSYFETEDAENPRKYGGTWAQVPSLGAYKWKRTG